MNNNSYVKIFASRIAPDPAMDVLWLDLSSGIRGSTIKYWTGTRYELIQINGELKDKIDSIAEKLGPEDIDNVGDGSVYSVPSSWLLDQKLSLKADHGYSPQEAVKTLKDVDAKIDAVDSKIDWLIDPDGGISFPGYHDHPNLEVLDRVTEDDLKVLAALTIDEDGRLKAGVDFYSDGDISAFGVRDPADPTDPTAPAAVEVYDGLDSPSTEKALSANMGRLLSGMIEQATDKTFIHEQGFPASTWMVSHNLGKLPVVTVIDSANTEVVGAVEHVDLNNIIITFSNSFTGKAFCN